MGYANIFAERLIQMMDKDYCRPSDKRIAFNIHVTDSHGDVSVIFHGNPDEGEKDCWQKHTDDGGAPIGFKMFTERALPYAVAQAVLKTYQTEMEKYHKQRNSIPLLNHHQKLLRRREERKLWTRMGLKGENLENMLPFSEVAHLE